MGGLRRDLLTSAIAIVVMILGGAVARPTADKLAGLGQKIAGQGSPPTAEQNAERARLMNRLTSLAQINAVLLVITVGFMAIGNIY